VPDLVARLARTAQPVLFANGVQDVGIPASASVFGATHAPRGTALLYGDAGHAFLFQHAEHFAATVDLFLR
jgi:pimeloyl-ACP methyl ester carboxylesterase